MKTASVSPPQAGAREYYVCSIGDERKGWMDGCMVWWRSEGHGYTYDLNFAGIFTDDDKERRYPDPKTAFYIPREVVDANAYSPRLAWWSARRNDRVGPVCEALESSALPPVADKQKEETPKLCPKCGSDRMCPHGCYCCAPKGVAGTVNSVSPDIEKEKGGAK